MSLPSLPMQVLVRLGFAFSVPGTLHHPTPCDPPSAKTPKRKKWPSNFPRLTPRRPPTVDPASVPHFFTSGRETFLSPTILHYTCTYSHCIFPVPCEYNPSARDPSKKGLALACFLFTCTTLSSLSCFSCVSLHASLTAPTIRERRRT